MNNEDRFQFTARCAECANRKRGLCQICINETLDAELVRPSRFEKDNTYKERFYYYEQETE